MQPVFWKYAGSAGNKVQKQWFEELMQKNDYILILGFITGGIMKAPVFALLKSFLAL